MSSFGSMSGRSTSKFNKIISFLTQKLIDAETSNKEIFDSGEDNLPENIDIFDIEMERDLGTRSTLKDNDNIYRMVEGANWTKNLRLWIKFENAGYLYDHARNENVSEVYGLGQIPILMNKKVIENVIGWEFHSFFNGQDQFAYTHDNDQIRVSEMFADGDISHISFMDSFNPISIAKQHTTEVSVLFSKVDDDQLKDGYAATMNDKGDLFFYLRRNFKQYSLFMKGVYADQLADEIANQGNFNAVNFNPLNYNTDLQYVSNLICSITKTDDHWWIYDKTTHNIKFMINGVTEFQSTDAFIVDPILDVPFQEGAYNTDGTDRTEIKDISTGAFHGTLDNVAQGQWQNDNTWFSFGGNSAGNANGTEINFPTIAAIDSATEMTISFMYKPDEIVNPYAHDRWLVSKNWSNNSSFYIYRQASTSNIRVAYKNSAGVTQLVTNVGAIKSTNWHCIIVKFKVGEPMEVNVDGVNTVGVTNSSEVATGGTLKLFKNNTAARGTISLLKVFTTKLGTADTQRILDEGYHNPLFPKSEKPQPVPDPDPPEVVLPFEVFYNLASSLSEANTVWLNSVAGAAPFFETYNVADGVDSENPELLKYDVPDGVSTGGGVIGYTQIYLCTDPDNNSSSELSVANDNAATAIEVTAAGAGSSLNGKKVTKAIFFLRGDNSPTGTVRCKVWNAAGAVVTELHYNGNSASPLNAAAVNTSTHTAYEFRNTDLAPWGANSMNVGWKVGIEYDNGGSDEDAIMVKRNRANPKSGEWNNNRNYDGDWDDPSDADDLCGELYEGGTGTAVVDPWFELGSGGITTVSESFGATAHNLLNLKPTKIVLRLKKTGTPTGTFTVNMMTSTGAPLASSTFSGPNTANSLTTSFADYTFTNLANPNAITSGILISVSYGGTGGKVCVMSNKGNTAGVNNYHGSTSYLRRYQGGFTNETTLDVSMKVYTGGDSFDADLSFTPTLTRIYERVMATDSSLYHKKLTKATFRLKKTGTPTGLISCVVRKPDDSIRFTLQSLNVADVPTSFGDVTFTNVFNIIQTELNDRICIEYLNADASNYVEVLINKDVFETTKTIGGTYSNPIYSDNAQIDISGKMYIGGEPDLNSRTRIAQKIIEDESIMDGKKLTKISVWLINPTSLSGNIHCIVYRGSDDQPMVTIETIAASGVGTGWTLKTFTNVNNGYVLDQNDKVAIVFEGGDSTHRIGVNVRTLVDYDTTNSHAVRYNGLVYDDLFGSDLVATMWSGGNTIQPPPNAIPDPTPTNNKDLLFCAGNNLLAGFARLLMREFRIYVEDTTEEEALHIYENRYSKTARSPDEVLISGIYKPF